MTPPIQSKRGKKMKMKFEKSLYNTLMKATREWCKAQDEEPHIQFILGTFDRAKFDLYNSILGNFHTLNTVFETLKGNIIEIPEKGGIIMKKIRK